MADVTSSAPPPAPLKGEKVLDHVQELNKWLRRNIPLPGAGLLSNQTPSGRTFNVHSKYIKPPPFYITQNGSLGLRISAGQVFYFDVTNDDQCSVEISADTATASNGTTYIYLTIPLEATVLSGSTSIFQIDGTITLNSGASLPDSTFDSDTLTDGNLYVEIGNVIAADGEITTINQTLKTDFVCWPTALSWDANTVSGAADPYVQSSELPDGENDNDIMYWDQSTSEWVVLAAPATSGDFFLKVEDGTLLWKEAGSC